MKGLAGLGHVPDTRDSPSTRQRLFTSKKPKDSGAVATGRALLEGHEQPVLAGLDFAA